VRHVPADGRGVTRHEPQDPEFERRVRGSFDRQRFMGTLGARLARVEPGEVDIELTVREELTQQHGFLHAGALATVADSACGYAALSLMPAGAVVLSVEIKKNMLEPAKGDRVWRGAARAPGDHRLPRYRVAHSADGERLVATMVGTMMTVLTAGSPTDAPRSGEGVRSCRWRCCRRSRRRRCAAAHRNRASV
jgi:uncharacterized protein (TIGR00369 family)